jgi:hypothetical protein
MLNIATPNVNAARKWLILMLGIDFFFLDSIIIFKVIIEKVKAETIDKKT